MVKLNPLLAKFSLPSQRARQLRDGQTVTLYVEPSGKTVSGTIEFIGPVTDAQSATVQIKARIDNHDGTFFSGERCTLQLPGKELAQRAN
jgi:multidrug efflux pump subunit AcrA (membrane-fusion protein)